MFKNHIFLTSLVALSCAVAHADSTQTIEVVNNSDQVINYSANSTDGSFIVKQSVPARAKAIVIAKIIEFNILQDKLFVAIFKNSPEDIKLAIAEGADFNKLREGKSPLDWALSFNLVDAAACLLQYGAQS